MPTASASNSLSLSKPLVNKQLSHLIDGVGKHFWILLHGCEREFRDAPQHGSRVEWFLSCVVWSHGRFHGLSTPANSASFFNVCQHRPDCEENIAAGSGKGILFWTIQNSKVDIQVSVDRKTRQWFARRD